MILRKPYAILIKYFKFIHLLLSFSIALVTFKLYNLYEFFKILDKTNYINITKTDILTYYSPILYLVIILTIILSTTIFLLMKFKNKPKLYYIFLMALNLMLIFYLNYSKNYMNLIMVESPNPITNGVLRDVSLFAWIINFASIFFSLLRAIGFDIKKFNFKKDIADLQIQELDNEEIEFNINIKKYEIARNLNKRKTDIKDFLKAKKIIFIIGFVVVFLFTAYNLIINIFVYNKTYSENENVSVSLYTYKVNKSYYINQNSEGNIISEKYKYIVVNLNISPKFTNTKLNFASIFIESNNKSYSPISNAYESFKDLGVGYNNQNLDVNEKNNYILVFKVDDKIDIDDIVLKHFDKTLKNGKILYKKIKLNTICGNNKNSIINRNLNEDLSFNDNLINIKSYDIGKSFIYTYNYCVNEIDCIESKDKLSIEENLILKLSLNENNFTKSTLLDLGYLTYDTSFNKNIIVNLISITPKKTINELYFIVPNELKGAKHIYLNFLTREKKYVYTIK